MFRKKAKVFFFVLAVLLLVFLSWLLGAKIKNAFHNFLAPIESGLWRKGNALSDFFSCFFNQKGLLAENERLKSEKALFYSQWILAQEAQKENQALKSALGLTQSQGFELVFAEVISQDISQDAILINQGKASGVLGNMPVITAEGILVGRTAEVSENFAAVSLLSFKNNVFDIVIATEAEDILAVAKGDGGFKLSFEWVPVDKEIVQGDKALTATLGGKFPKGLLVGEVVSFQKNPAEAFQKGVLLPYFTALSLEKLFVITNFQANYVEH